MPKADLSKANVDGSLLKPAANFLYVGQNLAFFQRVFVTCIQRICQNSEDRERRTKHVVLTAVHFLVRNFGGVLTKLRV